MEETNTSKKSLILGICMVVAAFVLGLMLVSTVKTMKSFDDTVSVKGLCEREVPADRVVLRIIYTAQDNDLPTLRSTVENNNRIILDLINQAGINGDEVKYNTANFSDRYEDYYVGDKVRFRYRADQTISIFSSDLERVRKFASTVDGDLLKHNIISNTYASYDYNGLNDIKPSMIAESIENARNSAEEFAKNSHSKIGKMRTASQGYFTIEDLDENTPQVKKIRVVSTVEYYLR